ncbi:Ubiquitin-like modifier HUB1 [Pseudocercospora fuligena]|uniref:Ubiquitin-like modifier HUB1 n=1 Tax=Pseudocercospora fuligena TaxID=685502 RepID=A0A8H6VRF4_9PEZI|nr:Ubiquitin-like modifier HUB1 [Pseudocercospora fuligena]
MASDGERSRSPARDARPKKSKSSGFKWKEKRSRDEDSNSNSRDSGRLERGYRDRSPRRDSNRDRDSCRRRDDSRERKEDDRKRDRSPRRREEDDREGGRDGGDSYRPAKDRSPPKRDDMASKFGDYVPRAKTEDKPAEASKPGEKKKKDKKPKPAPVSNEPMIVVNVNDRLGTKAAIPCLASDSVKVFKAMVAAHVGRQPHEIMLKRQGERPFKDQLTLEDYGVSNGVQLDLELDTGD